MRIECAMTDVKPFSALVSMPSEIRVMIYEYLFNDYNNKSFEIRNQKPYAYGQRPDGPSRSLRSSYSVDFSPLRQQLQTTYELCTAVDIHTSIMRVNRKIYEETLPMLYYNRIFSFHKDIEAIVPFFSDLNPGTRPLVQEISLFKRGFIFSLESNRCDWNNLCKFLRDHMQLKGLKLIVEGGQPRGEWETRQYTSSDFETLTSHSNEHLVWVSQLLEIKGIQKLDITSEIQSMPSSNHSSSMALFVAFSASIMNGFAEYLRRELIGV
ncbi:uncharacterized protein EAF01_001598 [Botrytis porri]|uniref:Uncharacterized protein n=1 Tax=Botrytis porri TaxID=87229 RepID=A0A4Z1L069_9HELO|nr:uncharacterized protein EAF01_001598 [Botrytis porri]KAF7912577.1 hypothetical protein EAF01_001598 [Botrytis porri]TGO90126.1 hypothetical protein BPOR_0078g00160 [Botrytis porri]